MFEIGVSLATHGLCYAMDEREKGSENETSDVEDERRYKTIQSGLSLGAVVAAPFYLRRSRTKCYTTICVNNVHPTPIIHIAGLYSTKRSDQLLFVFWMLPRLRQWLSLSLRVQLNFHSLRNALRSAPKVGPGQISIGEKREE